MGVPVLTLKGDRYISHFGESLIQICMKDWIADSKDDYLKKAIDFSSDIIG